VTPATLFLAGSISKPVAGGIVMASSPREETMGEAFVKTRVMNWVLAVIQLLVGVALLFIKSSEPVEVMGLIVGWYVVLIGIPIASAISLAGKADRVFRTVVLVLNWGMILFTLLGIAAALRNGTFNVLWVVGALAFLIPAGVNVRALRSSLRQTKESATAA
jgi:predicted cobalt transporter CbtA